MKNVKRINYCRLCKKEKLIKVLDFGKTPPANSFLTENELNKKEVSFPLVVNFCEFCGQLQLSCVVSPEILFRHYVWVSSTSAVTRAHFEQYAHSVFRKFKLQRDDFVVEMGSNDAVLLKPFKKLGARVVGVDPARNVALRATREGIPTLPHFFTQSIASQIEKKHGKAKIIAANNVFAHINDLDDIVLAVKILLSQEGIFIIEAPYTIDFVEKNLFDTVYHEHLSYLSISPLDKFFKRFGMRIFDVGRQPVHGGSVRIFVTFQNNTYKIDTSVTKLIDNEKRRKLYNVNTYRKFAKRIRHNKMALSSLLKKLKAQGASIAAYGAPAKSTTLLHYFNIGRETIDFIADDSKYKIGLFTPGKHIPIVSPKELYTRKPDYVLILAWNFADSIMKIHEKYKKEGGTFIVPVPAPIMYD